MSVFLFVSFIAYNYYAFSMQETKNKIEVAILEAENRILRDEVSELSRKPTYDQGFNDAIIKMGSPQNPGSYKDGWDAALKTLDGSYQEGYHTAIQQFGYFENESVKFLVPKNLNYQDEIKQTKFIENNK